jgi:hypothetical protein
MLQRSGSFFIIFGYLDCAFMTTVNGPEARANPGRAVDAFQIFAELSRQARAARSNPSNNARAAAKRVGGRKRYGPIVIVESESSIMTM